MSTVRFGQGGRERIGINFHHSEFLSLKGTKAQRKNKNFVPLRLSVKY